MAETKVFPMNTFMPYLKGVDKEGQKKSVVELVSYMADTVVDGLLANRFWMVEEGRFEDLVRACEERLNFWKQLKDVAGLGRAAVDTEVLAGGRLRFVEYQVREGGPYAGKELALLDWPNGSFMAGILREGKFFAATDPNFNQLALEPEDRIFFMTTPPGFDAIQACFAPRERVRRVMVVGGGNVGFMVTQELLRHRLEVTIIDHNPDRCAWLAEHLPAARLAIIPGSAHAPFLSRPDDFAARLTEFLDA